MGRLSLKRFFWIARHVLSMSRLIMEAPRERVSGPQGCAVSVFGGAKCIFSPEIESAASALAFHMALRLSEPIEACVLMTRLRFLSSVVSTA
jgi:hypothetical protein